MLARLADAGAASGKPWVAEQRECALAAWAALAVSCARVRDALFARDPAPGHRHVPRHRPRPLDAVPHSFCQTRTRSTSIFVVLVVREP